MWSEDCYFGHNMRGSFFNCRISEISSYYLPYYPPFACDSSQRKYVGLFISPLRIVETVVGTLRRWLSISYSVNIANYQ